MLIISVVTGVMTVVMEGNLISTMFVCVCALYMVFKAWRLEDNSEILPSQSIRAWTQQTPTFKQKQDPGKVCITSYCTGTRISLKLTTLGGILMNYFFLISNNVSSSVAATIS